jgi:mycothiol synthase
MRPPAPDEADAIADMINEESTALVGFAVASAEWIRSGWSPGADIDRDFAVILAEDGALAGYLFVEFDEPYEDVFGIGAVAHDHHGRGLGTAIIGEIERRAHVVAEGREGLALRVGTLSDEPLVAALMTSRGFREVRRFWSMWVTFDEPPAPASEVPGVDFRTLVPGQEREVHACLAEAFEDHWGGGIRPLDPWLFAHGETSPHYDPEMWHLAWHGDVLAGALMAAVESDENPAYGSVDLLGVRRAYRGRGIAEALLRRCFGSLHAVGREGAMLIVDSESQTGATRLYERVGMTPRPRFSTWERTLTRGG